MRSYADGRAARFLRLAAALIPGLALALAACGGVPRVTAQAATGVAPANGPQADYPVTIGLPYKIAGTAYTPEDVLNYDQVGVLAADSDAASGATGSHHTLPLPSYVEVTSLATGRTILVRLERRGPMNGHELVALSPGALEQLEARAGTQVRVRRVNPPEDQRALLRAGGRADPRMDTPMSLVEILRRKLPGEGAADLRTAAVPRVTAMPSASSNLPVPVQGQATRTSDPPPLPPLAQGAPVASPSAPAAGPPRHGTFLVQAAAFSTADRAENAARALEGEVTRAGRFFRVRTGPFATRGEAEASLAKVRAAGYSDARILTNG